MVVGYGPDSKAPSMVALQICLLVLSSFAIGLRVYSRCRITKHFGHDDTFILIAWLLMAVRTGMFLAAIQLGGGSHREYVPEEGFLTYTRLIYLTVIPINIEFCLVKTSLLFLYLRISVDQAFRRVNYVFLVFIFLNYLAQILVWIFQCDPINKAYDVSLPANVGECRLSVVVFTWYNCAGNVFVDLVLLSLPVWMMWGVPVARRQKLWVVGIFSLASFSACVISIIRMGFNAKSPQAGYDRTYNDSISGTLTSLESSVAMICACLPTYKAVLTRLFPKLKCAKSHSHIRLHHHLSPVPTPTFPPGDLKHIAELNTSSQTNTFDLEYCEATSARGHTSAGARGGSVFGTSKTSLCIHHHHNHNQPDETVVMPAGAGEALGMTHVVRKRESRPLSITQEFIREIGLVVDERRLVVEEMEEWEGGDMRNLGTPRGGRIVDDG
ncbi:unnamed protein product [Tuber aestivum]|uniref:Rhodopsin domain-containing protein n=1 Tax=Tuber aestivum TaxID=59557 RepID=A0A292PKI3_9PEZI|nr:unnamed protein product [Tuber aestivum]